MKFIRASSSTLFVIVLLSALAVGQKPGREIAPLKGYKPPPIVASTRLDAVVRDAVWKTVSETPGLREDQVAVDVIDLRDEKAWSAGEFRGSERIYPASVVKLFYLAAIERQLEAGQVRDTPELERGIRDMIVDSSNEATQYVLDVITGTSSGAELPPPDFQKWQFKRDRVNRFFTSLGYQNINADQKTFCEDAYGIEQQSRNYKGENRNALTVAATARLMAEIATGRLNTPERTAFMMRLLSRDWTRQSGDLDDQPTGFTGRLFVKTNATGTKLWSKAGWTSKARHDVAYVEMPDGRRFVMCIFTEGHANERDIIPTIAARVIEKL